MKHRKSALAATFLVILLGAVSAALAHEGEVETGIRLDQQITSTSIAVILGASVIVAALTLLSISLKRKSERMKWVLFLAITVPVVVATLYAAGGTVYLNLISETGGPVHWHADFEIWSCGQKVDIIDPTGLENRVGDPVLHEHGDDRVHVEGVVVKHPDVDLHSFFETIGGSMDRESLTVPTNDGFLEVRNGDTCNGGEGKLQAFLYRVTNPSELKKWVFVQEKLDNFPDYVLSPYTNIPPGDCIIIEFGEEKERTEHVCETVRIAIEKGDLSGS